MIQIDSYRILGPSESSSNNKYLSFKALKVGDPLEKGSFTLFPSGRTVQLKNCSPLGRTEQWIIEIKGAVHSDLREGSILIPAQLGVQEGRKALVLWKGTAPESSGMDLKLKALPDFTIRSRVSSNKKERISQISGRAPFPQIPGQIYQLTDQRETVYECVLLMAEPFTPDQIKQISKRVNKFGNFPGADSVYSMNLRVRGFICLPEQYTDKSYEGSVRKGNWLIMSRICEKWQSTIEKRASSEGGIREAELSELLGCPGYLVQQLVDDMIGEDKLMRGRGFLINRTETPEKFLSPMVRSFLEKLNALSQEGMNMKEAAAFGRTDIPDILQRRGLARKLDTLLFSEEAYRAVVDEVLNLLPRDRSFDLSDLTGVEGFSRSRLLQILDGMESDGLIRPCGDNKRELV